MATRLSKPITRLVVVHNDGWNVTITAEGVVYRRYKTRTPFLLPHPVAIVKAAWLKADADRAARGTKRRKRRTTRGKLTRGR